MPIRKLEYRIFLSSPTGLEPERDILRTEIQEHNRVHAGSSEPSFRFESWDHIPPGVGRPQARINKDLIQSDYLILILHDRWGSTTGEGGYTSGSLEELAVAIECLRDPDLPMQDIAIFFKEVDQARLTDPGPQLRQVLRLKQVVTDSHEALYREFDSKERFRRDARSLFSEWTRCNKAQKTPKTLPIVSKWIQSERRGDPLATISTKEVFLLEASHAAAPESLALSIPHGSSPSSSPSPTEDVVGHGISLTEKRANRFWPLNQSFITTALLAASLLISTQSPLPATPEEPRLVTVVDIVPSLTRGSGSSLQVVNVPPTRDVVLIPAFFDIPNFDSYRFELLQEGVSLAAWNEIPLTELDHISFILPRSRLAAGNLSARLYGLRGGRKKKLLQENQLEVQYH